jgi:hypothetical protein
MRAVIVHHHPGLGDHLICNGLVHTILDREDFVYLAARRRNLRTVECLYSEEPRVEVFPVDHERDDVDAFARRMNLPVIRIGFEHCDKKRFDESFYEQMGVPFEDRYRRSRLPRHIPDEDRVFESFAHASDYVVTHRENSLGLFNLRIESDLPRVDIRMGMDRSNNLLACRRLIMQAREIHCVNSSVLHLVDSLDPPGARYYHAVRRTDFKLRPCWTVVPYATNPLMAVFRRGMARGRLIGLRALEQLAPPARQPWIT